MDIVEYEGGKLYRSQAQFFEQIKIASPKNLIIKHISYTKYSHKGFAKLIETLLSFGRVNLIIVSHNANVVGLALKDLEIKSIPDSLNALKKVSYMVVERISKMESLPDTIGELILLKALRVTRCKNLQNIPDNIGNLTALEILDFSSNSIRELPNAIGNLLYVTYLTLSSNKLANLPETIGQLKNLVTLDLSYNKLQILPDSFGNLIHLKKLNLERNNLTLLPETIGNLTALKSFDASNNNLKTLPNSIKGLQLLESFKLSSNQIEIFPEVLKHLPKTAVYLGSNPLNNKFTIDINNLLEKLVNFVNSNEREKWSNYRYQIKTLYLTLVNNLDKLCDCDDNDCIHKETAYLRLLEAIEGHKLKIKILGEFIEIIKDTEPVNEHILDIIKEKFY